MAVATPQHEIAIENVEVPTVLVKTLRAYGGDQTVTGVCMQWFGQSTPQQVPRGSQFFFPLNRQAGDTCWEGKLETFRVAFVGQLKDWPNPAAAQSIADSIGHGSLDGWVVYLVSGGVVVFRPPYPAQREPASFLVPLPVMLADPNCGVITPQPYNNPGVVDEEMDVANPWVKCPGCDLRLPEDDERGQYRHLERAHEDILLQRQHDGWDPVSWHLFKDADDYIKEEDCAGEGNTVGDAAGELRGNAGDNRGGSR